jgi:sugar/nucleoside kinase (ribokinase family)
MSHQPGSTTPDYLVIGHITQDLLADGSRLGGTAVYSSLVAQRLGKKVAVYTSCENTLDLSDLSGIEIINQSSERTTTFKNEYKQSGREQHLLSQADELDLANIPQSWKKAPIVHLAPVAKEIKLAVGNLFPDSTILYSLQGWLRQWDSDGKVSPAPIPHSDQKIPRNAAAAILSDEDLINQHDELERLVQIFPLLVLTLGKDGAKIYQDQLITPIPVEPAIEIDPTGAGDIFAAAFIIEWVLNQEPIDKAALFATQLAAHSVTKPGIQSIPSKKEIQKFREVH